MSFHSLIVSISSPFLFLSEIVIASFLHSSIHSLIHYFINSFVHSFIHSFIHLFIDTFIHSFIHSLIHLSYCNIGPKLTEFLESPGFNLLYNLLYERLQHAQHRSRIRTVYIAFTSRNRHASIVFLPCLLEIVCAHVIRYFMKCM